MKKIPFLPCILLLVVSCKKTTTTHVSTPNQLIWGKTSGGSNDENGAGVAKTADGGMIVTASTISDDEDAADNHGAQDALVVKLDAAGNQQWSKAFGGSGTDWLGAVVTTGDGGYLLTGYSNSGNGDLTDNKGGNDCWVVKLDASGNMQWSKVYGGSGDEFGASLLANTDGGYTILGNTTSSDGDILTSTRGGSDCWLFKIDATGALVWSKTFGGSDLDMPAALTATSDGGYAITGYTASKDGDFAVANDFYDAFVIKIDGTGNKKWAKQYGGTSDDEAYDIRTTSDGGYIVAGATQSADGDATGNHGIYDAWVFKLDGSGTLSWTRTYGGSDSDWAMSIVEASAGGFVFAGQTYSNNNSDVPANHGLLDIWVARLDNSGKLTWTNNFGGSGNDQTSKITATTDSKYTVLGTTSSTDGDVQSNHGQSDAWTIKLSIQ